jgi:hypothetical protein
MEVVCKMSLSLSNTLHRILENGGEEFILGRDEKHVESMRVSAFNYRRKMPEILQEDLGIQKFTEDGRVFLRIFKRGLAEQQHFVRDSSSGKLIPAPKDESDPETARIISLMREDGIGEEEIREYLEKEK